MKTKKEGGSERREEKENAEVVRSEKKKRGEERECRKSLNTPPTTSYIHTVGKVRMSHKYATCTTEKGFGYLKEGLAVYLSV
jgi:hypothetical protein